jgi:hypothetical protein
MSIITSPRASAQGRRQELAKAGSKALRDLHPDIDFAALGRRLGDTAALAHLRDRLRALYKTG